MTLLPLLGVLVVILGFALRLNGLLVAVAAGCVAGLAGGLDLFAIVAAFGKGFNDNRLVSLAWLVLPVIGALERAGIQERARDLIAAMRIVTVFRLLCLYLFMRQLSAALGLLSLGGQASTVRPLIAPMAEAAAETAQGPLSEETRQSIRAHAAATDNIGPFFGEDIFVAVGSVLLMKGVLDTNGVNVEPLSLSLWAIPTAILAFFVHATRLYLFDRRLARGQSR